MAEAHSPRIETVRGGWHFIACRACGWELNCGRVLSGAPPAAVRVIQADQEAAWQRHLADCPAGKPGERRPGGAP